MRIKNLEIRNNVFLAPMAGVTDLPFRVICKSMGAGLTYSEMISAKGLNYGNRSTGAMLSLSGEEPPCAVQLFGSEPGALASAAASLNETGFALIDINMGCPAPKIVKNNEGCALMRDPALAGRIIRAVYSATEKPVTVKIRKGFSAGTVNAAEIAKIAEANGAAAITVHGRTREQYYAGEADWGVIAEVKRAVSIPVIGNGDVRSPADAARMLAQTGCDAVMIGRASMGNPWIFRDTLRFLETGEPPEPPGPEEKMETALRHFGLLIREKGEYIAVREMRRHLSCYIKGLPGAVRARQEIMRTETAEDMWEMIKSLAEAEM